MAMRRTFMVAKRVRKFFGKIQEVAEMPTSSRSEGSYDKFLQSRAAGRPPDEGLQTVFNVRVPISDSPTHRCSNSSSTSSSRRSMS